MAKPIRSRRISIAAGVLSVALAAPLVTVPTSPFAVFADAATTTANFNDRYTTDNFWNKQEAVVEGLQLDAGDKIEPTTKTIFNWTFRNDGGQLVLIRPQSSAAFRTGNVDIPVKVTPAEGTAFNTTLKVNVVDADPNAPKPVENVEQGKFNDRYTTANFWGKKEVAVQELSLADGTKVEPTANTIFNWSFRNDNGTLVLIRPQSSTAFRKGEVDIPVRVTEGNGSEPYTTTLKLNVVDARTPKEWEKQLDTRYPLDFEKSTSAKNVEGLTLPEGVTLNKAGGALPTGWEVKNDGTTVRVTPPSTFKAGDFDLPVTVKDGTDTFEATLKIAAKNPEKTPAETAGTVAGILGPILGTIIGGATGGGALGSLGNIIGGLIGGGTGGTGGTGGGEGGTGGGGGAGRLINVVITGNANPSNIGNNNGSPNVIVTNNANPNVIITDNVNPRDNFSNNGNPVITGNANPVITNNANPTVNVEVKDNLSNNGNPVITNNANPTVVITGNANPTVNVEVKDNANPVITGNANPVITGNFNPTDNGNNNGSNNSAVVTGNANPVITGNANPTIVVTGNANPVITGNANPVITGNANPTVVITDNFNPRDNGNNNGSNNSAVITNNANPSNNGNPTVVVTNNANNNGSNNSAVVTGNANPVITNNANPSNNGNPTVVVTNNANNNGSNNSAVVTGNANPVITNNANPSNIANNNGSNNKADVSGNANPVITGNANPVITDNANPVITGNANPVITGIGNPTIVVTDNFNPRDIANNNGNNNASNNSAQVTGNANPIITGNANGGLFGSSSRGRSNTAPTNKTEPQAQENSSLFGARVDVSGGSSDPRCITALVGLGLPLFLAIPAGLAQDLNLPGLDEASAQAAHAFNDAARQFGVSPAEATAVIGGAAGVVLALLAASALRNCIPSVSGIDVSGSSGPATVTVTQKPTTEAAPVVKTNEA